MDTVGSVTLTTRIAGDWRELATRGSDGLEISLLWSEATGAVKVAVVDARRHDEFQFEVAGVDALAAFHHPFAFAARESGDTPETRTPERKFSALTARAPAARLQQTPQEGER